MKPIIGANHRATRIEIVLPVDASGEYAFNEDGNPIKGKIPVAFAVPRFDCLERDQFKALNKELKVIDEMTDDDGQLLTPQERGYHVVLAMVRPFVSPEQLKAIEGLHLFELEQIADRINEGSSISLGELLASSSS